MGDEQRGIDHETKSDETEKNILFPGKVSDSVLIQLEMVHNLLQMFKMQAIQGDTTRKETTVRIYEKKMAFVLFDF